MNMFDDIYRGRRVLITGHTGFKGSWLAVWLTELGAEITGVGLAPPTSSSHWELLRPPTIADIRADIRDASAIREAVRKYQPEIVFHLAAQALVRQSYKDPLESWSTNVLGTANVLEACRAARSLRAVVVVTTDKVDVNEESPSGYSEVDRLGGYDPYSASKAAAELVVDSYRKAFFSEKNSPLVATARAGNVVGGGDWSADRLIPDIVRAVSAGRAVEIRSPHSSRSWLHVLDCLSGYLSLGKELLLGKHEFAESWNFGPPTDDGLSVSDVLRIMQRSWPQLEWSCDNQPQMHETNLLFLDSSKANTRLNWKPLWNLEAALSMTASWYRQYLATQEILTRQQLLEYESAIAKGSYSWIGR